MFHSSDDSGLFVYDKRGFPSDESLRLYEAKCFAQFNHRYASFDRGMAEYSETSGSEHLSPGFAIRTRYWVRRADIPAKHRAKIRPWILAYRRITNATNERGLLVSVLPSCGLLDSGNLILVNEADGAWGRRNVS